MSSLTLPGEIPGLLRRGSPVQVRDVGRFYLVSWDDRTALVVGTTQEVYVESIHGVGLDLSATTGRFHAALWLANRHFGGFKADAAMFVPSNGGWTLLANNAHASFKARIGRRKAAFLRDLDWQDQRAFPDGSRWVDAEALRRLVLAAAGREGEIAPKGGA